MKTILWSVLTFILWIGCVLLLEYDYRGNSSAVISMFSPLQWFLFSVVIYALISYANVYIYLMITKQLDISLKATPFVCDTLKLVLCIVPVTQIIIFIGFIGYLLHDIILPNDKPNIEEDEFEKELKRNTVQGSTDSKYDVSK